MDHGLGKLGGQFAHPRAATGRQNYGSFNASHDSDPRIQDGDAETLHVSETMSLLSSKPSQCHFARLPPCLPKNSIIFGIGHCPQEINQ
jgi:hypothetical protein